MGRKHSDCPSLRTPIAVLGVGPLSTRDPRVCRVANGRRARVGFRHGRRRRRGRGRRALASARISCNSCCRFAQYKEELPAARAMANASQSGNAAEPTNHRGSIKGPIRVDGHLQMPFRGCFLARASPNPTSGLPFPFRITSMSFSVWHGMFFRSSFNCNRQFRGILFCGAPCQDPGGAQRQPAVASGQ